MSTTDKILKSFPIPFYHFYILPQPLEYNLLLLLLPPPLPITTVASSNTSVGCALSTDVNNLVPYDVATFTSKVLEYEQGRNYAIIYINVFKFPKRKIGKTVRSFSFKYLSKYPWLAYSPSLDGALCVSCTLFGGKFPSRNKRATLLYNSPVCNWSSTIRRFDLHEGSHRSQKKTCFDGLHRYTMEALTSCCLILVEKQSN